MRVKLAPNPANESVVILGTDNRQVRNRPSHGPCCISCALFSFVVDAFEYDIYLEDVVTGSVDLSSKRRYTPA